MSENRYSVKDLAEKVSKRKGIPIELAEAMMNSLTTNITRGLNEDGKIVIPGLGKFSLKRVNGREGRNPQTGETIEIPAHNRINFLPDKSVREFINRDFENRESKRIAPAKKKITVFDDTKSKVKESPEKEIFIPPQRREINWWKYIAIILIIFTIVFHYDVVFNDNDLNEEQMVDQKPIAAKSEVVTEKLSPESKQKENDEKATPEVKENDVAENSIQEMEVAVVGGANNNLYNISTRYYGVPYLWPLIYLQNKDMIQDFNNIQPGLELSIPPADGYPNGLNEEITNKIVEGYIEVYFKLKKAEDDSAVDFLWVAQNIDCNNVFDNYSNQISDDDLQQINEMHGTPQFNICA